LALAPTAGECNMSGVETKVESELENLTRRPRFLESSHIEILASPVGNIVLTELASSNAKRTIVHEGSEPILALPSEWLHDRLEEDPSLVLAVTALNTTGDGHPVESQQAVGAGPVSVMLFSNRTKKQFKVDDLKEEILIRLSPHGSPDGVHCVFWDEEGKSWSSAGVSLATPEHLQDANITGGVWCSTTHLTIFAGVYNDFFDMLQCASNKILSLEEFVDVVRARHWWSRAPAVRLWVLLVCLVLLTCYAAHRDELLRRSGLWCDAFFLEAAAPKRRIAFSIASWLRRILSPSHLRVAALFDWIEVRVITTSVHSIVARKHGLTLSTVRSHVWGDHGFVKVDPATKASRKWRMERALICDEINVSLRQLAKLSLCERFCIAFSAINPVSSALRVNFEMSAAKRAKALGDKLLGSIMVSALVFSVSGSFESAANPASCPRSTMNPAVYMATALFSAALVVLPMNTWLLLHRHSFLEGEISEASQRWKMRNMQLSNVTFWVLGSLYSCACISIVVSFLANLSERDEWKWNLTFAILVTRLFVLKPVAKAGCLAFGFAAAISRKPSIVSDGHKRLEVDLTRKLATDMKAVADTHGSLSDLTEEAAGKVMELAERGIRLAQLLEFYEGLEDGAMPGFDPATATTHEVVRAAIIPLSLVKKAEAEAGPKQQTRRRSRWSAADLQGLAYATVVGSSIPTRMVTHNWSNKFRDLVAACVADALGTNMYERAAAKLSDKMQMAELRAELGAGGLGSTYWICAFSVNQHASICSQKGPWQSCHCSTLKVSSGCSSEMNKFDHMMRLLSSEVVGFAQIVAIDVEFSLLTRVWCIAELVMASWCGMPQNVIVHSKEALDQKTATMELLDVRRAEASCPEDKELIMCKVDTYEEQTGRDFNSKLRSLLLDETTGLLVAWSPYISIERAGSAMDGGMEEVVIDVFS